MIGLPSDIVIYVCTMPVDLRRSFDGLSGIVRSQFGREPDDGSLFLFINKRRDRLKALRWEPGGYVLWYKRLESGTFEMIPSGPNDRSVNIDATQLAMLVSGVPLRQVRRRRYGDPEKTTVARSC